MLLQDAVDSISDGFDQIAKTVLSCAMRPIAGYTTRPSRSFRAPVRGLLRVITQRPTHLYRPEKMDCPTTAHPKIRRHIGGSVERRALDAGRTAARNGGITCLRIDVTELKTVRPHCKGRRAAQPGVAPGGDGKRSARPAHRRTGVVRRELSDLRGDARGLRLRADPGKCLSSPKPFVWTQSAQAIMAKLERCPVRSV